MYQQQIPKRLFGQHFGVTNDDEATSSTSQRHVQAARIVEKSDALVLI